MFEHDTKNYIITQFYDTNLYSILLSCCYFVLEAEEWCSLCIKGRTTEQQESKTAGQQNSRTAEQQNSRTAEQQDNRTTQ